MRSSPNQAGFTLLEIMVVVLLMGLVLRLVVVNMGAFVPGSALDAQANKIRFQLDYLRSEAKIQGKPYSLELDLDKQQTRVILPPEDRLVTTDYDSDNAGIELGWRPLEQWVKIGGHMVHGREVHSRGTIRITFDENGFTADQTIYLEYDEPDTKKIWSIHIQGLNGTTTVIRNLEGKRDRRKTVTEGNF